MTSVCWVCEVHQPLRLRPYPFLSIQRHHHYENTEANKAILLKVANKCYRPTNAILLDLCKQWGPDFKIAFSISGIAIEQFKRFSPETLDSFKRLVETGCVELLDETYYHSLSSLFSEQEFIAEVALHREIIRQEFGVTPTTFRNTELIYDNQIAEWVNSLGYRTILTEGADHVLGWRSPNYVYHPPTTDLRVLLRNYRLSDDVAFRFGDRSWMGHPLDAKKYAHWIHTLAGNAGTVNLFMDYETFGEHQWAETGIFDFLRHLPREVLKHRDFRFATPDEVARTTDAVGTLDVPLPISWADEDRGLTAWKGNAMQDDALEKVYQLESAVHATRDLALLHQWRSLLTSDHFYYMCTKYAKDGDVHLYFNPYQNPYEAYINFQNVLSDFKIEIEKRTVV